jgi:hypothetical protein
MDGEAEVVAQPPSAGNKIHISKHSRGRLCYMPHSRGRLCYTRLFYSNTKYPNPSGLTFGPEGVVHD